MPDTKNMRGYKEDADAVANRIKGAPTTPSQKTIADSNPRRVKLDFGLHGYSRSDLPQHTGKSPEPKAPAVAAPTGKTGVKLDFGLHGYTRPKFGGSKDSKKPEPAGKGIGSDYVAAPQRSSGIGSDAKYPTRSSGIGSDAKYPTRSSGIGSDHVAGGGASKRVIAGDDVGTKGMADTGPRAAPKAAPKAAAAAPKAAPSAPKAAPAEAPKPSMPQNSEDGPWGSNPARMIDNSADLSSLFRRKK